MNGHVSEPANAEGTPATTTLSGQAAAQEEDQEDAHAYQFDFNSAPKNRKYARRVQPVAYDPSLLPSGSRSLTSIGLQAFGCGFTLALCLLLITYFTLEKPNTIWRLPAFFACLSFFHFMEYYITAAYNLPALRASSFLLFNNGTAYNVAHTCAALEILVSHFFLPRYQAKLVYAPFTITLGIALVVVGQIVRSTAMAQAGTNFNHTPVQTRKEGHELVTKGMYEWSRHPSYFGFFWWALGTQLLVGNKLCLVAYALALWRFFFLRIKGTCCVCGSYVLRLWERMLTNTAQLRSDRLSSSSAMTTERTASEWVRSSLSSDSEEGTRLHNCVPLTLRIPASCFALVVLLHLVIVPRLQ